MLQDVTMRLTVLSNNSGINMNPKILYPSDMFQADCKFQEMDKTVLLLFQPEG